MASGSLKRIWQWTLTQEAIAPGFCKDVLDMRESGVKDVEFFWLGRVPCRSVKLVGMVMGVQTYETRVVYHLDDGTAVIECHHRPQPLQKTLPPSPLEPLAQVGWSVTVIGRVSPMRDTRKVLVDSIVRCPSSNDEPRHWIAVRNLHKTHYSLDKPFEIPERLVSQLPAPTKVTPDSPSTSSVAPSSPLKSPASSRASPHKLRHPARLHTKDLTGNAFRIYIKHYMDNAEHVRPIPPEPTTPTKSSHRLPLGDETPRPLDHTPKQPRIVPLDFSRPLDVDPDERTFGFTVSYLRRVPELALMAKRVVKAEAKRRARDARKKTEPGGAVVITKDMRNDLAKLHPRMKRLFEWAVIQLVKEGAVLSWDGPARPCPGSDTQPGDADTSVIWKANSSTSTVGGNSTVMSNASVAEDDEDEGELTDPDEGEEVFLPLTSAFLATRVEKAIRTLTERATARAQASKDGNRPRVRAPAPGPAVREIVALLKGDDMWRNLSEFAVKEALTLLQDEGRAWMIGGDRWELTL
ncbi:hypothetical protein B0H15DRAFT_822053 [Mycena belliarum]|uniref:CST complex subunit STN1 n=1 Tax=Mycena belliarum TaxID=1033014 RepID=A0AAD6UJG0_9AGAR|nr:hypothetical protein B0H15DRAFT_822053 [Mycena belliae]